MRKNPSKSIEGWYRILRSILSAAILSAAASLWIGDAHAQTAGNIIFRFDANTDGYYYFYDPIAKTAGSKTVTVTRFGPMVTHSNSQCGQ